MTRFLALFKKVEWVVGMILSIMQVSASVAYGVYIGTLLSGLNERVKNDSYRLNYDL